MNLTISIGIPLFLTMSWLLAGCVGSPVAPESSPTHPANPLAAASPVLPFESGLLSDTNLVVPMAAPAVDSGHQHHSSPP